MRFASVLFGFVMLLVTASTAVGQPAALPAGKKVIITDTRGAEFRGVLKAVTADAVELELAGGPTRIAWTEIVSVATHDSNRNGFWTGFTIWAAFSAAAGGLRSGQGAFILLSGGLMFGGLGAAVDGAVDGRQEVYRRPAVAVQPLVAFGRDARVGIVGVIRWR